MSAQFDDLAASVAENTSVVGSIIQILEDLNAKIAKLIADGVPPGGLEKLNTDLRSDITRLAEAGIESTPAEDGE